MEKAYILEHVAQVDIEMPNITNYVYSSLKEAKKHLEDWYESDLNWAKNEKDADGEELFTIDKGEDWYIIKYNPEFSNSPLEIRCDIEENLIFKKYIKYDEKG